ncbi:MAG TPA: hypothetical protein VJV75_01100 [Candidatus Polarisedimenticolia bacterium]|nr:hypothetical protein [Candidatus Polarisedimenticolia bacterium]
MTKSLRPTVLAGLLTVACAGLLPATGQDTPNPTPDEETAQVSMEELAAPVPGGPVSIQSARRDTPPAAGLGRMTVAIGGNRRWCTFPDDRVMKQQEVARRKRTGDTSRDRVFTFGYQFTIAAVERSRPDETLMLFESPIFRTAVMRPASKLGRGNPKPPTGPSIGSQSEQVEIHPNREGPDTLVPLWQEQYRCTTVPEALDFDLEPGTYDVYMAFDVLLKSGSWTHRNIGYSTDIPVAEAQVTRVDAKIEMLGGGRRTVDILGAAAPAALTTAAAP